MKSKWESRERTNKHLALIISIALHVAIFIVLSTSTGGHSIQNYLHGLFGTDKQETVQADIKA